MAGEAANGAEVLKLIAEQHWDLLVLDISMPGKSGLELIKLVRQEKPRLPILIFSMHQEEQYALRALHAGAAGYLTKESDSEVLIAAMRKVAAGGVHVSEKVAQLLARERMPNKDELPHTRLSNREFQIFEKIVAGVRLTDIADELNLSIKTVSTHKSRILQKMGMIPNWFAMPSPRGWRRCRSNSGGAGVLRAVSGSVPTALARSNSRRWRDGLAAGETASSSIVSGQAIRDALVGVFLQANESVADMRL